MTKAIDNTVYDATEAVADNATAWHYCSAAPANHAGIAAVSLADVTVDTGDYTPADGDVSGRKTIHGSQTGVTVDANGTVTHLATTDGSTMLELTEVTSQAVTSGNTIASNAWDTEYRDPT